MFSSYLSIKGMTCLEKVFKLSRHATKKTRGMAKNIGFNNGSYYER